MDALMIPIVSLLLAPVLLTVLTAPEQLFLDWLASLAAKEFVAEHDESSSQKAETELEEDEFR